jgi:non-specific serine/threonine protein kinase
LAERHELAVVLPGQERHLRRMEVEHANLLAALTWFDRRQDAECLLRLSAALVGFWLTHGHVREGRDWLERALAHEPAGSSAGLARGRAQISLGRMVALFGEVERADRLLADGIAALRADDVAPTIAFALARQAAVANQIGAYDRAERLLGDALELATTIQDEVMASIVSVTVLANLGVAAHGRGDFDLARARHEQALGICRAHGYAQGAVRSLRDLGDLHRDRGDFARSLATYRECLELLGDQGDYRVLVEVLEGAALAAAAWEHPERAARLVGAAAALRERTGTGFIVPADLAAHERTLAAIRAAIGESGLQEAWAIGRNLTRDDALAEIQAIVPPSSPTTRHLDRAAVTLSPRESEVLRLLVAGLPDRVIAEALSISVRTVEAHVARIHAKLGVRTRTAAVGAALAAGLLDPDSLAPA